MTEQAGNSAANRVINLSTKGKANRDTPEQAEFRRSAREWLSNNNPLLPDFKPSKSGIEMVTEEQRTYYCAWQKCAYDAGLIGCDYAVEFGGGAQYARIAKAAANDAVEIGSRKSVQLHGGIGFP